MRKIKAIWRLIWSDRYLVYTSNCFGTGTASFKADYVDFRILDSIVQVELEAEEAVNYTKSLLTEI